jgi:hypothetical protein
MKFFEVNGDAKESIQNFSKNVAEKLEKTKYELILNHKQIVMIKQMIGNKDATDYTEDQSKLLDVLNEAKQL